MDGCSRAEAGRSGGTGTTGMGKRCDQGRCQVPKKWSSRRLRKAECSLLVENSPVEMVQCISFGARTAQSKTFRSNSISSHFHQLTLSHSPSLSKQQNSSVVSINGASLSSSKPSSIWGTTACQYLRRDHYTRSVVRERSARNEASTTSPSSASLSVRGTVPPSKFIY